MLVGNLNLYIIWGIIIPFVGTSLGSAMVFFLNNEISKKLRSILLGFAAGIMVAASFWSLLEPAIELSSNSKLSFLPAAIGFLIGSFFILILDFIIPHMHTNKKIMGPKSKLKRTTKLILAVTLHNIPEGMAVGIVYSCCIGNNSQVSSSAAFALALGIAIQNFPEGAIVSAPLRSEGIKKIKTFFYGVFSGIVEPIAAIVTILATNQVKILLPYFLSFAAGAMMYVVVEELIPEISETHKSEIGVTFFTLGFILMMILDLTLG